MTNWPKQPENTSFGQLIIWFLVTLDEIKRAYESAENNKVEIDLCIKNSSETMFIKVKFYQFDITRLDKIGAKISKF